MATRANPFYQYRNPAIGYGMNGLAEAMFGDGGVSPLVRSQIVENQAQAGAAQALAGYRGEQTRGERRGNAALAAPPRAIAELLLSGGVLKDDPVRSNPNYREPPPTDFSLFAPPAPTPEPMFMPGLTASDKLAAALQEAVIRKIKLDDLMKSAGIQGYTNRAASDNPTTAMPFLPFLGVNPNTQTSLTPEQQDAISARDAGEVLDRQRLVNEGQLNVEGVRQGGANWRAQYNLTNRPVTAGNNQDVLLSPAQGRALGLTPDEDGRYVVRGRSTIGTGQDQQPGSLGGAPVAGRERATGTGRTGQPKPPANVPPTALKLMRERITSGLKTDELSPDAETVNALVAAAGTSWQSSRNPEAAADEILQSLRAGSSVNGVKVTVEPGRVYGTNKKISRSVSQATPPAAAIEYLRANPALRGEFDKKYGPGAADRFLKQ